MNKLIAVETFEYETLYVDYESINYDVLESFLKSHKSNLKAFKSGSDNVLKIEVEGSMETLLQGDYVVKLHDDNMEDILEIYDEDSFLSYFTKK